VGFFNFGAAALFSTRKIHIHPAIKQGNKTPLDFRRRPAAEQRPHRRAGLTPTGRVKFFSSVASDRDTGER
jgi:hypothetical protein